VLTDIQVNLAMNLIIKVFYICFICSIKCLDRQHQVQASDGL